jgi:hypothetical protein
MLSLPGKWLALERRQLAVGAPLLQRQIVPPR